jgi:hypothetical protein
MENNINHKPDYQDWKPQNLSTSPQKIVGSLFSAAQIFIWIHPTGGSCEENPWIFTLINPFFLDKNHVH